jgi:hypothetical protein
MAASGDEYERMRANSRNNRERKSCQKKLASNIYIFEE